MKPTLGQEVVADSPHFAFVLFHRLIDKASEDDLANRQSGSKDVFLNQVAEARRATDGARAAIGLLTASEQT